jgi:Sec-independent protein secretion pathway component TatC
MTKFVKNNWKKIVVGFIVLAVVLTIADNTTAIINTAQTIAENVNE